MARIQEKEIIAPFIELTTTKAGKLFGISEQAARRRCEHGLWDAYKTFGGQWRVKIHPNDMVPREEAEAIKRENAALRSKIDAIIQVAGSIVSV
jgi:hypothetical protein